VQGWGCLGSLAHGFDQTSRFFRHLGPTALLPVGHWFCCFWSLVGCVRPTFWRCRTELVSLYDVPGQVFGYGALTSTCFRDATQLLNLWQVSGPTQGLFPSQPCQWCTRCGAWDLDLEGSFRPQEF